MATLHKTYSGPVKKDEKLIIVVYEGNHTGQEEKAYI